MFIIAGTETLPVDTLKKQTEARDPNAGSWGKSEKGWGQADRNFNNYK